MQWEPVFERIAVELRKMVPATVPTRSVTIETAPGELIDKITILEIKAERIGDPERLRNVRTELEATAVRPRADDRRVARIGGSDGRVAVGQRVALDDRG